MTRDRQPPRRDEFENALDYLQAHDAWMAEPHRRRLGMGDQVDRGNAYDELAMLQEGNPIVQARIAALNAAVLTAHDSDVEGIKSVASDYAKWILSPS